jgi:hypothetical protein
MLSRRSIVFATLIATAAAGTPAFAAETRYAARGRAHAL